MELRDPTYILSGINHVWAQILDDAIVDSLFLNENVTREIYMNMLEEVIDPFITEQVEKQKNEFIITP